VSVRGRLPVPDGRGRRLELVSETPTGQYYCVALELSKRPGGLYAELHLGTEDATSYADCTGGWPDAGPSGGTQIP
jgi:hypothetical protein